MTKANSNLKAKRRKRRTLGGRSRQRLGTDRLRLSVHRTLKHISAQVIDDGEGRTLAAVSSTSKALADSLNGKTKTERATVIGAEIARLAKEAGVETVAFDRGYSKYHGRVKALAEAAREGGLQF
jgi:large subunit ribosomal protein L18